MGAQCVVVLAGQGPVLNMSPGRSAVLKLLGGATGVSIMVFEELMPAGTKSTLATSASRPWRSGLVPLERRHSHVQVE
jgi:hypothetical protein